MAAILGDPLADKRWLPQRHEAVVGIQGRETTEVGIDEQPPPLGVLGDLVSIEVAGDPALRGHIEPVAALKGLPRRKPVVQPPELIAAGHEQTIAVGLPAQAHRFVEQALVQRQAPRLILAADEEQPVALIGGQRQADVLRGEPVPEACVGLDVECGAAHGVSRGAGASNVVSAAKSCWRTLVQSPGKG